MPSLSALASLFASLASRLTGVTRYHAACKSRPVPGLSSIGLRLQQLPCADAYYPTNI